MTNLTTIWNAGHVLQYFYSKVFFHCILSNLKFSKFILFLSSLGERNDPRCTEWSLKEHRVNAGYSHVKSDDSKVVDFDKRWMIWELGASSYRSHRVGNPIKNGLTLCAWPSNRLLISKRSGCTRHKWLNNNKIETYENGDKNKIAKKS